MEKAIVRAYLKELRQTPRKVSLVASLVRGRTVDDALVILSHTPKRAAKPLAKLISSARANATNNHGLKSDNLIISTLSVTSGARLKRFRPVSRGMAHAFQKRTANVLVEISGEIKPAKKSDNVILSEAKDLKSNTNGDSSKSKISQNDKVAKGEK